MTSMLTLWLAWPHHDECSQAAALHMLASSVWLAHGNFEDVACCVKGVEDDVT